MAVSVGAHCNRSAHMSVCVAMLGESWGSAAAVAVGTERLLRQLSDFSAVFPSPCGYVSKYSPQ